MITPFWWVMVLWDCLFNQVNPKAGQKVGAKGRGKTTTPHNHTPLNDKLTFIWYWYLAANNDTKDHTMKKLMLMLALTLALTLNANMTRADDFDDAIAAINDAIAANDDAAAANDDAEGAIDIDDYLFNAYKPLAEQGNAFAQFNLGLMYYNGEGVIKDYREAVRWWRKAAEQGDADAQYNLGVMYHNGHGVLQDDRTAHMWHNIARANGSDQAGDNIEIITPFMTGYDIFKARDMAERCLASNYKDC